MVPSSRYQIFQEISSNNGAFRPFIYLYRQGLPQVKKPGVGFFAWPLLAVIRTPVLSPLGRILFAGFFSLSCDFLFLSFVPRGRWGQPAPTQRDESMHTHGKPFRSWGQTSHSLYKPCKETHYECEERTYMSCLLPLLTTRTTSRMLVLCYPVSTRKRSHISRVPPSIIGNHYQPRNVVMRLKTFKKNGRPAKKERKRKKERNLHRCTERVSAQTKPLCKQRRR